ncbi:hypothetical protein [Acetatifactor aquisgranensis]|uniref:hypothetical protein n=1 Tax=Acetatifactor aquisgranensis TaxID=2941233 RepID=UPI00203EB761|nr:hypothetical protein [Acetatifactor aquisgranensis]
MDTYTESLENRAREISPEEDIDYSRALVEVVSMFRNFDEALDTFIISHGYSGDRHDVDEKTSFIKAKFQQKKILPPRNIRNWYTAHKRIKKETAIRICFAFDLTVEESEDFMRRICLLRSFDCHNVEEAVCYYAISNHLDYPEVRQLLDRVPKPDPRRIDFAQEVLYTSAIIEEIKRFKSSEELIGYISANIWQFGYNNATAYKYICGMWKEIAGEDGLAAAEKKKLYIAFNDRDREIREAQEGNQGSKPEKPKSGRSEKSGNSLWETYLQILGLAGNRIAKLDTDRSLKPILKDNELLHAWAEDSFPSRGGLEKILNREHVSEQLAHKTIILLVFYRFWVKLALKSHSYQARGGDTDRCICEIDRYLMDAGYPELYPGDPFDWIILHAVENEFPLLVFRDFMRELFYVKENDIDARYAVEWC